jgi:hypothetical protein
MTLMNSTLPLYYLSSLAGLGMVLGGIWLIYKQKIYIDSESKQVTEIETPLGKFKTNAPALALFALGFVPLIYPVANGSALLDKKMAQGEKVQLKGHVDGNFGGSPVQVYAVVYSKNLYSPGDFELLVPNAKDYTVLYVAGSIIDAASPEDDASASGAPRVLRVPPWHLRLPSVETTVASLPRSQP